ncbi:hypothetical protein ACEPAG_3321 [Sanghuangporus baumii]
MSLQVGFLQIEYTVANNSICRYTLPDRPSIYSADTLKNYPTAFSLPITYLAVVGNETADGNFFHFRLSAISETPTDHEQAVRINMQPSYTDMSCPMRGVALIEHITYPISEDHGNDLTPFCVQVSSGTTVATLLRIIFDKYNMDQYVRSFNDAGQGCRHWCASVLERLAQEELIDPSVPQKFADYEVQENRKFGSKFPMPRIMGTFYVQSRELKC